MQSKRIGGFNRYIHVTETNWNVRSRADGMVREDFVSVDLSHTQFFEGFIVLREFLIELCHALKLRESDSVIY